MMRPLFGRLLDLLQALVQTRTHVFGGQLLTLALIARDDDSRGGNASQSRETKCLPEFHRQDSPS